MRYIFCLLSLCFLAACSRTDENFFHDEASIYFAGDQDIDFTFTKYRGNEATLLIPLEIGGYKTAQPRTVGIEVVSDSTTAVAGLHYEALPAKVTLPADSFMYHLPVKLFNTDPKLKTEKVRLFLRLVPNENFQSGIFDKQEVSIEISDILVKPAIWDAVYSRFFGVYSQTKHRKILEICNIAEIPDEYDGGSYNYKWDAYGRAVNNYFKVNYPQYDENNQVIEPWL